MYPNQNININFEVMEKISSLSATSFNSGYVRALKDVMENLNMLMENKIKELE